MIRPFGYPSLPHHVRAMMRGDIPTARAFACPICHGPASISVSRRGEMLSLSVGCPCSGVEMDGCATWPGWEALLAPLPPDFDPNPLSLGYRGGVWSATRLVGIAGDMPPCRHCGAPLVTRLAQQCWVCGTDWHDPDRVIRHKEPTWERFGLDFGRDYHLELCQSSSGVRSVRYRPIPEGEPDPHRVLETAPHPAWQWVAWGQFATQAPATTGELFTFNKVGTWLTWTEVAHLHRALRGEIPRDEVAWVGGVPPKLSAE